MLFHEQKNKYKTCTLWFQSCEICLRVNDNGIPHSWYFAGVVYIPCVLFPIWKITTHVYHFSLPHQPHPADQSPISLPPKHLLGLFAFSFFCCLCYHSVSATISSPCRRARANILPCATSCYACSRFCPYPGESPPPAPTALLG